ncbi:CBS domain-containing protein [Stakelama pacifica]|uniref:CBS domain protein n=1 Tax=Stakelama pacifica TaxID=517720 RepID=A0A4R6F9T6_9SPHN|nr:CBS domain-containing protein [Stakelama pacifica]TDN77859.1 CBS domain protein [Stakelama pacifica]GGP00637.1 inosine-5-monophosphate dehydrogenase [Stakelama pacifica]
MTIAAILTGKGNDVLTVDADTSAADAVTLLAQRKIGAMPVMESGKVAGIFSERDMIYCLAKEGPEALARSVRALMTSPAVTVEPEHKVLDALAVMTMRRIRHLPVVQDGRLIGLVSIGDLVKYRIDRIEKEADAMRDYIRQA